jgi:hypothetical protein
MGAETHTCLPASAKLRPLRDQLIVEPLSVVHSRHLVVLDDAKPLRGIVKAVGPGCYPKKYDHPEKHRRTKTWDSTRFLPTQVKVGDVVELGGREIGGYAFEGFFWGDVYHINCRELDVAGVLSITAKQARQEQVLEPL